MWQAVASSADGTKLAAVAYGGSPGVVGGIWTAQATIQPPPLLIAQTGARVSVSWPALPGWILQTNNDLTMPVAWSPATGVQTSNGTNYLRLRSPTGSSFFRLSATNSP
jgi:hypothetical protein